MKRATMVIGLLLAGGTTLAATLQDSPTAIVARVTGTVEVHRQGGGVETAGVGTRLFVGDSLAPAEGAAATLLRQTGETQMVPAGGIVIAAPEAGDEEEALFSKTARVLAQASSSDARSQPNRQGMIRPIPGEPVQVAPRNGLTVIDPRPTFTWYRVPDATAYRIQIRRADGGAVRRYEVGEDTTWTLPDDAPPLVPGAEYRWTVGPAGAGRVATEQAFTIVDAGAYSEVAESLASLGGMGLDPAGDGLFLAALAYRDAGLYYEAESALEALAATDAELGADYFLLLGEIYDAMGRLDAASEAFDRADAATP